MENQAQNLNEEIMIALNFRTSQYNTLKAKLDALSVKKEWKGFTQVSGTNDGNGNASGLFIDVFGLDWTGEEVFDKFEMHGYTNPEGDFIQPLIDLEANLDITGIKNGTTEWYDHLVYTNMSQYLPNASVPIDWRDTDELGKIPTRAIGLRQSFPYGHKVLTQQEMQNDAAVFNAREARMSYDVPYVMLKDFFELRQDVSALYQNSEMPPNMMNFMLWQYKRPYSGDYKLVLKYRKPNEAPQGNIERTIHFNR